MEIKRSYPDVDIKIHLTDDELVELISQKSADERIVFFRKLFQTDISKTFPFNLLKGKF